jgi:Glycosyl hydrolase catalytic core
MFILLSFHMLSRVSFWCCLVASLSLSLAGSKNPKRGLGFTATPDDIINANQSASVISWLYNWASMPPAYLATSNIKYIPMQWGSSGIPTFSDDVQVQEADAVLVRQQFFAMKMIYLTVNVLDLQ